MKSFIKGKLLLYTGSFHRHIRETTTQEAFHIRVATTYELSYKGNYSNTHEVFQIGETTLPHMKSFR